MRTSSTAALALLTVLTFRSVHARGETADAPANNKPPAGSEPEGGAAPPPVVQLEDPKPRQGHLIALGFHGISTMAFDRDRGTRQPTFGQGVSLRLGESVTDWLSLSLAFGFGSTYGARRDKLTQIRFGVTSQWYFTQRWFVQAGLGALNVSGPDPEDYGLSRGRYGDMYLAGLGYDLYLSDSKKSGGWVLTPMISADVAPDSKFAATSVWVGVELSWFTGLSRDKLNLPNAKAYSK